MKKPSVDYPCKWPYKVIGSDQDLIEAEISAKLSHMQFRMSLSNQSKKGKYVSFHVEAHVSSDKERIDVFNTLKSIPTVKIVF
jgi:putative lipoic acid-binding regulatory protein